MKKISLLQMRDWMLGKIADPRLAPQPAPSMVPPSDVALPPATESFVLTPPESHAKRPTITEDMRQKAAQEIVGLLVRDGWIQLSNFEDCVSDIVAVTQYERDDGYAIAKELDDRFGWSCNMDMVETLNQFSSYLDIVYRDAEKQWNIDNPAKPRFAKGDVVMWRGKPATVHGIDDYRPQTYLLRNDESKPNSQFVVRFEEVSELSESEKDAIQDNTPQTNGN